MLQALVGQYHALMDYLMIDSGMYMETGVHQRRGGERHVAHYQHLEKQRQRRGRDYRWW